MLFQVFGHHLQPFALFVFLFQLVSLPMVTKPTGVVGTALRPPIDLYRSPGKTITISPSAVRVYSPNMAKLPQGTHVTIHSRHSSPVNGGNHLERVLMVNNLPNGSSQLGKRLIPVSIGGQQNDRLIAVPASTATSADAALNMAKAIVNAGSSQPNSTVLFANRIVVPNQILTSLNAGRPAGTTTVAVSNNNNSTPISTVFCGGDTNTVAPATPQTLLQ